MAAHYLRLLFVVAAAFLLLQTVLWHRRSAPGVKPNLRSESSRPAPLAPLGRSTARSDPPAVEPRRGLQLPSATPRPTPSSAGVEALPPPALEPAASVVPPAHPRTALPPAGYRWDRPLRTVRQDIQACLHLAADAASLQTLRTAPFASAKRFPGVNVKMQVQLAGGMRTMYRFARCRTYKDWCTNFVSEVLGYHAARVMARDTVPPIVLRRHPFSWLCSQQTPRECEEFAHHAPHGADGAVTGSLQEMWPGVTMKADAGQWNGTGPKPVWPPSPRRKWCNATRSRELPSSEEERMNWGQWSDLLLFDYLTDNNDRFLKGTNMFWRGWEMPWIDNGAGFARALRSNPTKALCGVCKFRRQTVRSLRQLQGLGDLVRLSVEACEGPDVRLFRGMGPKEMLEVYADLSMRQTYFLTQHLQGCIDSYGEEAVLSL